MMSIRLVNAMCQGWSFGPIKRADSPTSRHCLWAKEPNSDEWQAHKIPGNVGRWLDALLDEAGVPD